MRNIVDVDSLSPSELERVLELASSKAVPQPLSGQGVALLFEKPSARTRNSTEMAVVQLGGHPTYIRPTEVGLGKRETVEDVTRTLACYYSAIGARVFSHETIKRMAAVGVAPIINLLSDEAHPMQALADLLTLRQELGTLEGKVVAYVGDANNVACSLAIGAAMSGLTMQIASPAGYGFGTKTADRLTKLGAMPTVAGSPAEAVDGAHAVYTDVWTSMGQESEAAQRLQAFASYTVDEALMSQARPDALFLHCLPAHRGEEVSAEVIDGARSRVWLQAANRMHSARGLLWWMFTEAGGDVP